MSRSREGGRGKGAMAVGREAGDRSVSTVMGAEGYAERGEGAADFDAATADLLRTWPRSSYLAEVTAARPSAPVRRLRDGLEQSSALMADPNAVPWTGWMTHPLKIGVEEVPGSGPWGERAPRLA